MEINSTVTMLPEGHTWSPGRKRKRFWLLQGNDAELSNDEDRADCRTRRSGQMPKSRGIGGLIEFMVMVAKVDWTKVVVFYG